MPKTYNLSSSRFFCTRCGKEGIPINRKFGQFREAGHLKKLYCLNCKEDINHAEVRDIGGYSEEDFKKEFKLGRFIDGERVELSQLYKCSCIECPYNIEGKCWNANNSAQCKYKPKEND